MSERRDAAATEPRAVMCANCHLREGTQKFGESATMVARGYFQMWCEVCTLLKQIEHAEERAAVLPGLRARLEEVLRA